MPWVIPSNTTAVFLSSSNGMYHRAMDKVLALMRRSAFLRENETGRVEGPGFSFHHLVRGAGRPVILVHGGGVWLYSYRHIIAPLSGSLAVHALDMPGHGFTWRRDRGTALDLEVMAGALKEYTSLLGIEKASLVGHSWGGAWVIAYALLYPEATDRIVLIDSSGLDVPDTRSWELLKIPFVGEALVTLAPTWAGRRMLSMAYADTGVLDREAARETLLPLKIPGNRKDLLNLCRNLSWKGLEQGMRRLGCPAMLIWGEHDRYLDKGLAGRFRDLMEGLEVHVVQGSGHCPHEERPELTSRLIAGFLCA